MVFSGEREGGSNKIVIWDSEVQSTMYITDKQQNLLYSTRKYDHNFIITLNGV